MKTSGYSFLTDEQVEQFLTQGFVVIKNAFSREQAAHLSRDVWTRLGYNPEDKATWAKNRIHMPTLSSVLVQELAPRAYGAICELCGGEERLTSARWGDGFIVNVGDESHTTSWEPPSASVPGWHKDGDFFRHFLDSPEQGLLTIVLWSDVLPTGGATFVAADSVPVVAKHLAAHPEGIRPDGFDFQELVAQCSQFLEATGEAGDVYLMHPYLLHASSKNALRLPRLITNPPVHLKEPMDFNRPDGNYSLVEAAVLRGLGVESFDFVPTSPRERIIPERERMQVKMREEEKARLEASNA
ncbi:phytanoyl-CoA dioxygenase family protein [Armatimonas sp.]|uniref:phytanoyl-CoA dioxygenase family protein n=1 Tax=Armatimonas sp. TaxID=1872638 RepID=UPI00286B8476|nr:phytanoyl-CoA dioxygenase family protein [Armatimonas sp.]